MKIVKNLDSDTLTVAVIGRLDTVTSPSLEAELDLTGVKALIFDCTQLEYISSAGLRVLLSTLRTMKKQGSMVLRNVNGNVMEVFEVTGFDSLLTIE